jgi:protein TonB
MKKEKKDKDFIKSAYYEGGKAALEAFVKKELRYPKEALAAKVEGTVSVRYIVDYKGNVIDAHIISGLGHGCDEEALRIVRSLRFKVPNDGKIKSKYTRKLHIHFRLPGAPQVLPSTKKLAANQGASMSIQYHVTAKSVQTASPKPKSSSYEIKITLPIVK